MKWIVKQVLVGPGMLTPRFRGAEDPIKIFNVCLDRMWLPGNFGRLPPKLGQSNSRIKADQWKLAARIIFVPLLLAMRDGDTIGPGNVPRGSRRSPGGRHQAYRANVLYEQRVKKNFDAIGQPHFLDVLAAVNTIDKRSVTPNDVVYAQDLLQTVCVGYAENNIPLPPNFHYLMHLEESMLKYALIYNSHVWAMECANGMLGRIRHNGRSGGVLEGTLMRGWWSYTKLQNLIYMLRNLRTFATVHCPTTP
ncbi:hypothetical protein FRC06_006620 [Ceratobasidium sp. 370]|nr:hypothetical protein FRC06_006620 [Ceratobasidium sp. 370]